MNINPAFDQSMNLLVNQVHFYTFSDSDALRSSVVGSDSGECLLHTPLIRPSSHTQVTRELHYAQILSAKSQTQGEELSCDVFMGCVQVLAWPRLPARADFSHGSSGSSQRARHLGDPFLHDSGGVLVFERCNRERC